jgi:hypothetical protein
VRSAFVAFAFALSLGCAGAEPAPKAPPARPAPPPAPITPVPETLALVASQFGLTMQAEGITWKVLRRNVTRFDWSGRPSSGDRELLYSFWMDKLPESSAQLLPQIVGSAAANLTDGEPCRPIEQPPEILKVLGVERVVTVCFEPSTFYGKEFRQGVMHGIVRNGSLTLAVVLSNDRIALVPLPKTIGTRGAP